MWVAFAYGSARKISLEEPFPLLSTFPPITQSGRGRYPEMFKLGFYGFNWRVLRLSRSRGRRMFLGEFL